MWAQTLQMAAPLCVRAGEKGRRIRELTSVVQKRFKFPAERRRACYGVLRFVMESGAKGCEVIVSGKLRAQRAKSMKFKDGYMVSSGDSARIYIDRAVRHVLLRQGVLGIKASAMPCVGVRIVACVPAMDHVG